MGCILKSSAKYVFDYFGSIFENTNFDTGSWLQFSLSFYTIHNPLEFLKPEWWNSNGFIHLLLCGVWDCISDCLDGLRQPPLQFLVPKVVGTTPKPNLGLTPFNQVQCWLRNALSKPRSAVHGPWNRVHGQFKRGNNLERKKAASIVRRLSIWYMVIIFGCGGRIYSRPYD